MATETSNKREMATRSNAGAGSSGQSGRGLARWNPFSLFDELLWGRPSQLLAQFPMAGPRLDVYGDGGNLVVKAEVPGVRKEDLQVELDRGDLVIRGETRAEDEVKEDQYYRMERRYGSFYRRVPLGFDVDPEKVQADLRDGVLELRIPKPAEAKSSARRVPVR